MQRNARWGKRERLFNEQDGRCHWCDGQMALMKLGELDKVPNDYATFEHLDDRNGSQRGKFTNVLNAQRVVLACKVCNEIKGKESEARRGRASLADVWPHTSV